MSRRTRKDVVCKGCGGPVSYWSKTGYCKKNCFSKVMENAWKEFRPNFIAGRKKVEDAKVRKGATGK